MLISVWQKITASKETGLSAWRTHIEGAIHIVRERGRELFQNKYSVQLFNAVRLDIVCCLKPTLDVFHNPSLIIL